MNATNPADPTYRLGIDLGGTKIEAILLDPAGRSLLRERVATPRDPDDPAEYEKIRHAVHTLIRQTLENVPPDQACTIGVGIPGTINDRSGRVQNANTTGLIGHPFQQDLEQLLGRPIAMENDANCFTLAEARQGAASGYHLVFGIIMGTGCGGGISIDGRIHTGRHRIGGEWGHFLRGPGRQALLLRQPGLRGDQNQRRRGGPILFRANRPAAHPGADHRRVPATAKPTALPLSSSFWTISAAAWVA
jgi:fructokinase